MLLKFKAINDFLIENGYNKEDKNIKQKIGYSETQVSNIISSNSLFLNRTNNEIISILECLSKL